MKFRDGFLIALIILLVIYLAVPGNGIPSITGRMAENVNREDVNRETATLLDRTDWKEFQLPVGGKTMRLLTNAAVVEDSVEQVTQTDPRIGWRYYLEYQLVASDGSVVKQSGYHFRSKVRTLIDGDTGEEIHPLVFGQTGLIATQTRLMQVPLGNHEKPAVLLRVRIGSTDPGISEVVARVTTQFERKAYWKKSTWNQMTRKSRDRLSRHYVYNHNLLTDQERSNLLRWQWSQAPTLGESESRHLYFVGDVDDLQANENHLPEGLYVEPGWKSTIPVPAEPGNLRLTVQRLDSESAENVPATVNLLIAGPEITQREERAFDVPGEQSGFALAIADGGLVEVTVSEPVVIRAFWAADSGSSVLVDSDPALPVNESGEYELNPEPLFVRTYLADRRDVVYPVSHSGDSATPFRTTVRIGLDPVFADLQRGHEMQDFQVPPLVTIGWEFINAAGDTIESGEQIIPAVESPYERLWKAGRGFAVSEPVPMHFSIPVAATGIRFHCDQAPILINGAVRPAGMQATVRVPADYRAFEKQESTNRRWFILRPQDHAKLIAENRSFVLRTRPRPSDVDADIVSGNYDWVNFQPDGNWIGRQMLVPADAQAATRTEATDSTFSEIESGQMVKLQPYDGGALPRPRLIFAGEHAPGTIRVYLEGQMIFEQRVLSSRGEIDLAIPPTGGTNRLLVETENQTRLFLCGFQVDAPRFLKRTALCLNRGPLEFTYTKSSAEEELITLLVYRDETDSGPCQLKVDIREKNRDEMLESVSQLPTESWTIRNRLFDLAEMDQQPSVLYDCDRKVDTGHRCFLKLGTDLPAGEYVITARRVEPEGNAYALLYRTRPGRTPTRKMNIRKEVAGR